ncbi:22875_t:CDS:10, partial [Entrophospora sp. SA101]
RRAAVSWGGGSTFGSGEQNIEVWKPIRRLAGHESDVADLSWSPDNTYLASCGFDSTVYIWNCQTSERLHKLEGHSAFVKGVSWDPIGEYLATQLRFGELVIGNWSPEGSHLAIPNACQGSVPVAIALRRDEWKIDVSMIGHESPTEVVCFSPILYHIRDQDRGTIVGGVCAIGSQDHGVSIWATSSSHPLLVFKQLFTHCILDLSWSPDGRFLFACSYDGTATILEFKKNQFGEPLKPEEQERILSKHGYKPKEPVIIENTTQLAMEEENAISKKIISSSRIAALMGGDQILSQSTLSSQTSHIGNTTSATPAPGVTNPTSTNSAPNLTQNLQQQRQRATQGGGGGGGQGGGNMDDLNFLRNQPHFRNLRQFVQQNPSLLQPLLQQIGAQNPELLQLINSNQATFMRLLQEPDEGGEGNLPPPQYVSVTQEEKEAIDRLEALGFDRALAIEAYLACDKNEEMAANYLFDHMNDEEKKK